jgi:hypothetical protein
VPHIQYFHIPVMQAVDKDIRSMGQHKFMSTGYFAKAAKSREPAKPDPRIFKANDEASSRLRVFLVDGGEDVANSRSCRL